MAIRYLLIPVRFVRATEMKKIIFLSIVLFVIFVATSLAQQKEMIDESLKKGISLFQRGKHLEALVEFEIVLELDPGNAQAIKYKRRCAEKIGPKEDRKGKPTERSQKIVEKELFSNELNTLSFNVPMGYQYEKSGSEDAFIKGDCRIALSHFIKMTDAKRTREEILHLFKKKFAPTSILEDKERNFDGRNGYELKMIATFSGQENTVQMGIVHMGRVGYLLYGMSPAQSFRACSNDFAKALASLRPQRDFPDFSQWILKEGKGSSLYAFPKSYAAQNIEKLFQGFNETIKKISITLGIPTREKVRIFLYPDQKTLHKVTLRDSGFAIAEAGEAHLEWFSPEEHQSFGHEVTHIITYKGWGDPGEALFGEGIAVYLDLTEHDLFRTCKKLKKEGKLLPLSSLLGERWFKNDPFVSYKQSGAFVRFLIEQFGKEKFSKIYTSKSLEKDVLQIYGKTLKELEDLFVTSLR